MVGYSSEPSALPELLVETFMPEGPLVVGVDETLERRRGKKIAAKGVYRDPVRSSKSQVVKTTGLRWVCVTLLAEVTWARKVWALPFLSALAPSERYCQEQGIRHKPITELAGQLLMLIRRWCPDREIVRNRLKSLMSGPNVSPSSASWLRT